MKFRLYSIIALACVVLGHLSAGAGVVVKASLDSAYLLMGIMCQWWVICPTAAM